MAEAVSSSEEVKEFLSMNPEEGKVWLESDPYKVGILFRDFVAKHGHRCIKEFDLRTPSWGMAPESLVSTIQAMVKSKGFLKKNKKESNIDQVMDKMELKLTSSKKRALRFIINLCGKAISLRESTKSMLIKTVDAFRKAYRYIIKRLYILKQIT